MKVYAVPSQVPAPKVDYNNYDREKVFADEDAHRLALAEFYRSQGYTGKNTGRRISFSVGDGSAEYLLIEGKTTFLIHLPYGDGYSYLGVQHFPKAKILALAAQQDAFNQIFAKQVA